MRISLASSHSEAWLIGDPHLGRKFEVGVPIHRRGEREARQFEKFKTELLTPDVDYIVMVGDLFDHPHVGFGTVLAASNAVFNAALMRPNVRFIMMAGNHDRSRNLETVGAWEMFKAMLEDRLKNLVIVDEPVQIGSLALFPWQWDVSAEDQVAAFVQTDTIDAAIGHWDLQSYGGDDSHIAPVKTLWDMGVTHFYSGHYHIKGRYEVDDLFVNCTGSLEPYSHGEDPNGEIYVTMTLTELKAIQPELIKDKCVRLCLADGEEMPDDIDCLALTRGPKLVAENDEEDWTVRGLGEFDWSSIISKHLKDVDPEVRTFINDRMAS